MRIEFIIGGMTLGLVGAVLLLLLLPIVFPNNSPEVSEEEKRIYRVQRERQRKELADWYSSQECYDLENYVP
jgi:hypothetical protein